jgi:PAS domain S-box-containing protein
MVSASEASALQLVVGLAAPFRIHAATRAFLDMFQLSVSTCIGRSLALVQGPETNVKLLVSIFETAGEQGVGKEANAMLMFYSSSGDGHLFRISIETQSSPTETCIVSLELMQATPLQDAVLPDGRAKVIVSADQSLTVHVSPAFEKMYGYLWSEIKGRTLGFITGPNTNMALLHKQLISARDGHSEAALFLTNARDGQEILTVIQVNPVIDVGVVTQVVVFFSIIGGDIDGHTQSSKRGLSQQSTVQDQVASNSSRSGDAPPHSEDVEIAWAKRLHAGSQFHFSPFSHPFSHETARKQELLFFCCSS